MNQQPLSHSLEGSAMVNSGETILELLRHMTDMARDDHNQAMATVLSDALTKCQALHLMDRSVRAIKRN